MLHNGGHVTENDNETHKMRLLSVEIMSCLKEYVIFLCSSYYVLKFS